ncbi:hypothetical protein QYM36_001378 [Artemia franciscana]|uniref:Uncharacterized protein n=1 Tax=Artemia franciscana TaxID=6661 RepID=A0AA88LFK6_ARTSF|nr:hypothetical protein QYM36_001378 [Artemia franciscana]
MPNYLAVINLATAGLNGALLGSDEEEIVILVFVVVDVAAKQVVGLKEFFVKPRAADINENVLSEQARDELGLQEDQVRSGKPLESAIEERDGSQDDAPKTAFKIFVTSSFEQYPEGKTIFPLLGMGAKSSALG